MSDQLNNEPKARQRSSVRTVVVIGVSGSGKSTVAQTLAQQLDFAFCDADELHSRENIEKMVSAQPLSDLDRLPWLHTVGRNIEETLEHCRGVVVACSALKRSYRDVLREYDGATFFVLLNGSQDLIQSRVAGRTHEFMPPALLPSQFLTLELLGKDELGVTIDISQDSGFIARAIIQSIRVFEQRGPSSLGGN